MIEELKHLRQLTATLVEKDELLAEQTGNWKFALDAMQDLVFISGIEGKILFVNSAMKKRLSRFKISSMESLPCIRKIRESIVKRNITSLGEIYIEEFQAWFEHSIAPVYDDFGNLIGFICILRDITSKKEAEDALMRSEEKFRKVTQTAADAIVIANEKGNITDWNFAAERLFGYSRDEIVGMPLVTIMPERYRDQHLKKFEERKTRSGSEDYIGRVIRIEGLDKDGNVFPIELVVSSWSTTEGVFFSGVIRSVAYIENMRNMCIEN